MIIKFEYVIDGDDSTEVLKDQIMRSSSPRFMPDDALLEKMGRPFYEVALDCTLDTETGEITINGARA